MDIKISNIHKLEQLLNNEKFNILQIKKLLKK